MANLFSVAAFFIVFREVLEAALVIGVMLAYLQRTGADHLKKWVWWGMGAGVGLAVLIGIGFGIAYWVAEDNILTGQAKYIFEGFIYLTASLLITTMILWMLNVGKNLRGEIESQMEAKLQKKNAPFLLFISVFMNVFREGIEVILFLIGVGEDNPKAIPIPAILGLIVGVLFSLAIFKGLLQLNVSTFFMATSMILVAFAAGLFSRSWHEFQEAEWLGAYEVDKLERPWWNAVMWSTKACCNDKTNEFFAMARALFGYQDTPTYLEFITYFGYWWLMGWAIIYIYREQVIGRKDRTATFVKASSCVMWFTSFVGMIFAASYSPDFWNNQVSWIAVTVTTLMFVLSTISVLCAFDFTALYFTKVAAKRQAIMKLCAVGWALLLVFSFSLTTAQMICQANVPKAGCSLPVFFYWLLIFSIPWATQPQTPTQYTSLALLAIALVISLFYCAYHSFWSYLMARDIDEEGCYDYTPTVTKDERYGAIDKFDDLEGVLPDKLQHHEEGEDADYSTSSKESEVVAERVDDGMIAGDNNEEAAAPLAPVDAMV